MIESSPPTEQEETLYLAMTAGDWDTIAAMHADTEPDDMDQFETDYANAHARYQADHEAPEDEREQATIEQVDDENQTAERAAGD
jgi:DnaJ-domain-containing protein 1